MAFLDLNHHVESVYYQVSALSDYTLSYNFHQTHCRTNANSILVQVHTNSPIPLPCCGMSLHEEILNERADITSPSPYTQQNQSVQTLWVYGNGLLVENSSPDPLPIVTMH